MVAPRTGRRFSLGDAVTITLADVSITRRAVYGVPVDNGPTEAGDRERSKPQRRSESSRDKRGSKARNGRHSRRG
jgi:hypothetical protein